MERMCLRVEERYRMGQIGKKRVEQFYRHEDMIQNYKQVYAEVMENGRIGFSLKKLFNKKGYSICAAHMDMQGLICAGPMILGVIL